MKKLLFLALTPLVFTSCRSDFYDGDTRVIIEGSVEYNNSPLKNAEINIYPVYNFAPKTSTISEININSSEYDLDKGVSVSKTYTNELGKISLSIPRNEDTSVFVIKISRGYDSKYYGYISQYNTVEHYVNLGTLTF